MRTPKKRLKKCCGLRSDKRGNAVTDTILILVVIFVLVIVIYFGYAIFNDLNDEFQADNDLTNTTKQNLSDLNTRYPSFFDGLFVFAFILLWAFILVASYVVDTNPIFMIFAVILLIFVFMVAAQLTNTYEDIIGDDYLSGVTAAFPMTNFIMSNLLIVIIVIGLTCLMVLFAKNRLG